jgi:hypothetical protein
MAVAEDATTYLWDFDKDTLVAVKAGNHSTVVGTYGCELTITDGKSISET